MFCTGNARLAHFLSVFIFGQYTLSQANLHVFLLPWWPACSWVKMSVVLESGISTCLPLNTIPASMASSSQKDQQLQRSFGRSCILSGHPWWIISFNALSLGSLAVSVLRASRLFGEKFRIATVWCSESSISVSNPSRRLLSSMSSFFSGFGSRLCLRESFGYQGDIRCCNCIPAFWSAFV